MTQARNLSRLLNKDITTYMYTATAGQTVFTGSDDNSQTLTFDNQSIMVTYNGVMLEKGSEFTVAANTVTLLAGAEVNAEVNVIVFNNASLGGYVKSTGGDIDGGVNITSGNVGIGESNPGHKLHINGGSNDEARVRVSNTADGQASLDLDNSEGYFRTYTDAGEYRIYDQTDGTHRFLIDTSGNIGVNTTTPTEQLHLYKTVTNGGHHTYMKLHQYQPDLGGIGEHGSFIDFDFQDNNDNHRPQVQIGAELGNRNETDTGQESEGRGNFVVKTTDGASPYNPAYGTAPTEVFRVTYDGYINAKGAIINSKKIESSTNTNSTNTGAVVVAATAVTMTKRNHDQSRFLYSITLSHEVDGTTSNTNGFLRLEYRISSLGQTGFTALNKVITVGGMSDQSGGTNNNSFQMIFTPPNFNKNETIEMRLVFNKSNAQSVHFNQQGLSSQPSGTSNYALGYVLEMGL